MNPITAHFQKVSKPVGFRKKLGALPLTYWHLIAGICVFFLAVGVVAWRVDRAPDVFTDEILYTRLGIRVASEGALVWDSGRPVFVHPPLYFLLEAGYLALTTNLDDLLYSPGDIFAQVHHVRALNAVLAGLTTVLLYGLGARLRGAKLGVFLVVVFLLDPFGVRINRRAMIETLAALLTTSGLAVLLVSKDDDRRPLTRAILAGLLLGAALLTKDLTFTAPLAVLVFGLWEVRRRRRTASCQNSAVELAPFLAAGIAFLSYALVPLWALTTGHWERFVDVKILSLQRLFGLVHTSGWNRQGVSLVDFLTERLVNYGSTYLVMAMGAVATVVIFYLGRRERSGKLLSSWGFVLFPFFSFVALIGTGNDQFFYFLLLPSVLLIGYALTLPWAHDGRWSITGERWRVAKNVVLVLFLILILPYNLFQWWTAYGVGVDTGYRQLAGFVRANVPPGELVNASGDALKFRYFFPDHWIADAATPKEAQDKGVRFFVLAPKDVRARYGRVTPELAEWLTTEGQLRFVTSGDSYGEILFYQIDYPRSEPAGESGGANVGGDTYTFAPAKSGFVGVFLVGMMLWCSVWIAVVVWLEGKSLFSSKHAAGRYGRIGEKVGHSDGLYKDRL